MKVKENSVLPPCSSERIHNFEKFYNVKLPVIFLDFFRKYNGASPENLTVNVNGKDRLVETFLCLVDDYKNHQKGSYDIAVVLSQIEDRLTDDEDLIGAEIIPFAALFGGDFLCLDCSKSEPDIVLWDHDESEELSPVIVTVSGSVDDFFKMLIA